MPDNIECAVKAHTERSSEVYEFHKILGVFNVLHDCGLLLSLTLKTPGLP